MIAIDDSESMSHNKAGQLACESLALIGNAMSNLEVGQISLVKFGDGVQVFVLFLFYFIIILLLLYYFIIFIIFVYYFLFFDF